MNPQFEPFAEFIRLVRIRDELTQEDIANSPDGRELIRLCDEHASLYAPGEIGEANIVAVHPFYDEIYSDGPHSAEMGRLIALLGNADRKRFSNVLLEGYLDYPEGGSMLAEKGLVDKVIFTIPDRGIPVNDADMKAFARSRENYVGGCYGERCARAARLKIKRNAPSYSTTRPISDALLFSSFCPYDDATFMEYHRCLIGNFFNYVSKMHSVLMGVTSSELLQMRSGYGKPCKASARQFGSA